MEPRVAICGHTAASPEETLALAREHRGYAAIDVSLVPDDLGSVIARADLLRMLGGGDVHLRFHLPLGYREIGHADPAEAERALAWMSAAVTQVALAGGDMLTVHAGLPSDASRKLALGTAERLRQIVEHGAEMGVRVCLENLRWGLTSNPRAFMELVAISGAGVTLDIGHAASSDVAADGFGAEQFARLVAPYVRNAHVYEREVGHHIAPHDLTNLAPALDVLLESKCDWWVVELTDIDEARRTRAMLCDFLEEAPVRLAV